MELVDWVKLTVEVVGALGTVAVAFVAYSFSRRSSKLQALLAYEQRWFEMNRDLAGKPEIRDAYGSLSPDNARLAKPELRFMFYVLGQGVSAYHLRKSGVIKKGFYKDQISIIRSNLGGAFIEYRSDIDAAGYPEEFVRDLEKVEYIPAQTNTA